MKLQQVAGQDVVKHLLQSSDVLIENFKAGGLAKQLGRRSEWKKSARFQ